MEAACTYLHFTEVVLHTDRCYKDACIYACVQMRAAGQSCNLVATLQLSARCYIGASSQRPLSRCALSQ